MHDGLPAHQRGGIVQAIHIDDDIPVFICGEHRVTLDAHGDRMSRQAGWGVHNIYPPALGVIINCEDFRARSDIADHGNRAGRAFLARAEPFRVNLQRVRQQLQGFAARLRNISLGVFANAGRRNKRPTVLINDTSS